MAEYQNEELGVRFTIPDRLTVREQLAFYSGAFGHVQEMEYGRYWKGLLSILDEWECKLIPDPYKLDLDEETNPDVASVLIWCSGRALNHMNRLEGVPKN